MYLNDVDFTQLPVDLQDRIEEKDKVDNYFLECPFCGGHDIKKNGLTDLGNFIYECDDCDAEFSGEEIVIE